MKKLISLVLALALVLAVAVASAATVTVSNPGAEKTYTYYKVFDITYSGELTATSYTKTGESDAFLTALQGSDSPFTLTETTVAGTYNVEKKSDATGESIRNWLQGKASLLTAHTGDDFADGYYLMMVVNGDGVTERATTFEVKGEDVTIIDKNQTIPGPDKQESVDGGTTYKYVGLDVDEATVPVQEIGGIVNYKVTGTFSKYVGVDMVQKLKFVDTMSKGLTFDGTSSVTLKINGTPVTPETLTATVNETTKETTLTIEKATVNGTTFLYNAENTYELTYTAHINEDAIDNTAETEQNEVVFSYNLGGEDDIEAGHDDTEVKSYDATIVKVDGENNLLNGATFKVSQGATVLKFVQVSEGVYRLAKTADEEGAVEELAPSGAVLTIKGLKNGSYTVDEVQVPAGYNRLIEAQPFSIDNRNLDASIESNKWVEGGVKVINNQGTQLPSTGGIGTTIFYILGGLLVVGAAVILVARRKASN